MKQFCSVFALVITIAAMFFLQGCPGGTVQPSVATFNPSPLVTFDALNSDGFNVTPDTVAQASTVMINVSGSLGNPDTTFTCQPGVATLIDLGTAYQRPLILKFFYKTTSGDTLARDFLRIDDTQSHGVTIPDMDVIMGLTSFPQCPPTSQAVNVSTSGNASTFSWNPGDAFEVKLTQVNNTAVFYKFRIHPVAGTGDDSGTATLHHYPSHTCLSDIEFEPVSTTEMAIMDISSSCTVKASNNGTVRTVTVKYPNAYSISVRK